MASQRRAYLHLGIEKTGTTTLQSFLASNREALERRGVAYPLTPGWSNHLKLNAYAMDDDKFDDTRAKYDLKSPGDIEQFRQHFRRELAMELSRLDRCTKFVFSNEHSSSRLTTPEEAQRLLDLFEPHFEDIRVILYLREQGRNMVSSYSTNIRNGSTRLPDFQYINWKKYDYYSRVTRWSELVGRSNVVVRIFDHEAFVGNDLLLDFLEALDEPWDENFTRPSRKNLRLDARSLETLRLFNEIAPSMFDPEKSHRIRRLLVQGMERLPPGPMLAFPPDKLRWLREECAESNRRLAREFFGRDQLFPAIADGNSNSEVLHRQLDAAAVVQLLARVLEGFAEDL